MHIIQKKSFVKYEQKPLSLLRKMRSQFTKSRYYIKKTHNKTKTIQNRCKTMNKTNNRTPMQHLQTRNTGQGVKNWQGTGKE